MQPNTDEYNKNCASEYWMCASAVVIALFLLFFELRVIEVRREDDKSVAVKRQGSMQFKTMDTLHAQFAREWHSNG